MSPRRTFHENRLALPFLRWIVPVAAILLSVAVPADPAGSGPATSTGTQVTMRVPFARESIDEIRALAPLRSLAVTGNRAIPFLRIQRRSDATVEAGLPLAEPDLAAPFLASSPAPSAPMLDSSFAGLGNPPPGQDVIPPDTMGAAGPSHLVSLLNSDFGVFDKAGNPLQSIDLQVFWSSLGTGLGEPANFPFDPKILYDQHSGRFIAITLGGRSAPDSWVMIAVSPPSGPTGAWDKWAIDADLDNNVQLFNNSADYPGLGVDEFNVYVTANMFNGPSSQFSKVWVVPKAQLLPQNPSSTITWFEFRDPPGSDFSMQPAHTFGTPGAEYFLFEGFPTNSNRLGVAWMDNVSGTPVWHSPLQVAVTPYTSSNVTPGAPQLGLGLDNTIDTSDTRMLNAVYRNGSVWATHHVVGPSGKVEVAWYRINPGSGTVQSQGRVTDPNRWFYYPSIAVNKDNVAAIGFSGSSTAEYVGGYYTVIQPSTGAAEAVALLKAGEAPYYKTAQTFGNIGGSTDNRWGDFSATVVDPADDTSFWTLQEYAMSHDTFTDINNNVVDRSRWGTWWGKFTPGNPPAPPPPLSGGGGGGGGGCLSIPRSGGGEGFAASLFSAGILLLPACALGIRRFFRRRQRAVPIRHPLC
jgi:hypothetical protein